MTKNSHPLPSVLNNHQSIGLYRPPSNFSRTLAYMLQGGLSCIAVPFALPNTHFYILFSFGIENVYLVKQINQSSKCKDFQKIFSKEHTIVRAQGMK